ncbi:MAG: hypothetical protein IJ628_10230 [Bacteroidaceae bacterium]|nr:hypothetical protein [Bacteroidaceae bacterium]
MKEILEKMQRLCIVLAMGLTCLACSDGDDELAVPVTLAVTQEQEDTAAETSESDSEDEENTGESDAEEESSGESGAEEQSSEEQSDETETDYDGQDAYSQSSGIKSFSQTTFTSTSTDENAVKVSGGTMSMTDCLVNKTGGDTSDHDGSSFYGTNAAILSTGSGTIEMRGGKIYTTAKGANAIVAYGGTVSVSDVTIECLKSMSRGIHATGGGSIYADNLTVVTHSETSSTIATDRGGGTVTVNGGSFTAKGSKSSVIYSTGKISVKGITGISEKGPMATVEGANAVIIENSDMTSCAEARGILLHQSNSGDAEGTKPSCDISSSTLTTTHADAPLCFVTNVAGTLTLTDVTLDVASGTLMSVEYYKRGDNSTGNLVLKTTKDSWTYKGDVSADDKNNVTVSVGKNVNWYGAANTHGTAKSATVTVENGAVWNLTGDTYVTKLTNNGTVNKNGYKLTCVSMTNNGNVN